MTILKIYKYPHPVLREKCLPINTFDDTLRQLVDDMLETMYACPGAVGLAAPQVGHPLRLFIVDISAKSSRDHCKVMINPKILQASRNKLCREGCLSFPEYLANIKRATRVTVRYQDTFGQFHDDAVRDLEAIAIQHELDHLEGILLIDRVDSLKTDLIRRHGYEDSQEASDTPETPGKSTDRHI